ncbi:MAG: tetratricopeptide repeat protein [bacterium]
MWHTKELSEEASTYITEALEIIESQVDIGPEMFNVKSTGSEGLVMEAVKKFKSAFDLSPKNPLLHYAYASCLHLSMQYKSAEEEMRKCHDIHSDFILAKFALDGWAHWQSVFTLPPWSLNITTVHPALSQLVKTSVLLATRDGIMPRATLFLRDAQGDFQDLQALRTAKITLASVISPINNPQIIAIYGKIYDDPYNPYDIEVVQVPFRPRGDKTRVLYEYLCIQDDIDFAIIDHDDQIVLNKKLTVPSRMKATNDKIFELLSSSDGSTISMSEFMNAIMRHQQVFAPSDVEY